MSEFVSDNFFTNELNEYHQGQGASLSSNIARVLARSPFDLTDEEKGIYQNEIVPIRSNIKQALKNRYIQSGADNRAWMAHLPNTSQSIIGMLANEMLGEMVATPVETPVGMVAIPEQKIIQNMQMSFFTTQYYQYCIEHSRQVPEILIRILDKAPLGFKKEEREYYTSKVVPYKQNIKQALSERLAQSGYSIEIWRQQLGGSSVTVIGHIAGEMLSEIDESSRSNTVRIVGGVFTVLGGAMAAIGSIMPWATASSVFKTVSKSGIDGDGKITLCLGIVAIVIGSIIIAIEKKPLVVILGFIVGAIIATIGILNLGHASTNLATKTGIGLYLVIGGGGDVILGSIGSSLKRIV